MIAIMLTSSFLNSMTYYALGNNLTFFEGQPPQHVQQNPEQHCPKQHWPRGYTVSIGSKNFRATLIFSELHCFYIWQEASRELIFDVREYFIEEKVGIKVLSSDGLYKMKL